MTLDLDPFARSVARLREGLARYRQDLTDLQIRDGLIQRFEFTPDFLAEAECLLDQLRRQQS